MDDVQKQIVELVKNVGPPDPIHYVDYAVEELAKDTLNNFIRTCDYCEECSEGTKSLVSGNPHGAIMIIGEHVIEPQSDKDYVYPYENTEEGNLINEALDKCNANKEQIIWMNVVNCFTHKKIGKETLRRAPSSSEINNCKCYIDYAIDAFKPLYIIVIGNIALNVFKKNTTIDKEHGKWFYIRDNIQAMATYAPSTIKQLESIQDDFAGDYKEDFFKDIASVFIKAKEDYPDSDVIL